MAPLLLSIVEIGGYPRFSSLYLQKGFEIEPVESMRKATKRLKKIQPAVIVAEFNFQSDFRDRISSLEMLIATVQRIPGCKVIVFYEKEQRAQLQRVPEVFDTCAAISFPIDEQAISEVLYRALEQAA
ncbi:hypothetical protein MNBD_GAMMA11-453 [hydrothermal vent metagenome]|uniref:Response regulatory domain-containing protein n=1 Tax=hydrothermal vent metagenome TaxID=652676 RepID=A0A3B0XFW2_9ZZZZ